MKIHRSPWLEPEHERQRFGLSEHERAHQQRDVDAGVGERGPLQAGERQRPDSISRRARAALGALTPTASGPSPPMPRRPRRATDRSRGATMHRHRARGRGRRADRHPRPARPVPRTSPRWGSRRSASPRTRSGETAHSSLSSRTSVSAGLSPRSTAPPAPSAQRPAHEDTQAARRPASQRPSAERVTHRAATLWDASPATRRRAQRRGCSSIASPCSSSR